MALKIIETADGSSSFYNETLDETYSHSRHGAIQEANHVFLKMGLEEMLRNGKSISILEIGFGTGLNAWLTAIRVLDKEIHVHYTGVEGFPLSMEEISKLNYTDQLNGVNEKKLFQSIHESEWEKETYIHDSFSLLKHKELFENLNYLNQFDLIYFDAFGPKVQPDLWSENIF